LSIGGVVKKCYDRIELRKEWWEEDAKKKLWE
jgi:hypothetical protein